MTAEIIKSPKDTPENDVRVRVVSRVIGLVSITSFFAFWTWILTCVLPPRKIIELLQAPHHTGVYVGLASGLLISVPALLYGIRLCKRGA